jgi:hypothetical protein
MSYLIAAGLIMTLAGSLFIAVTSTEQQNTVGKRFPWISAVFIVMFLFVLAIVPMEFGAISRGESSALPWVAFHRNAVRHGMGSGLLATVSTLTYNLWTFWVPGHLFANYQKKKHGRWPVYPYVVNALAGLLLSIERGPVYRLFE